MIINLYDAIRQHPDYFKQLQCRDLLFTRYDCPQTNERQDLFSACSYVAYVLEGKRVFHFPGETIDMSKGTCRFIKKGGWIAEMESQANWCVLVFFIQDSYLKTFIHEFRDKLPLQNLPRTTDKKGIDLHVNETTEQFFQSMLAYFVQPTPPPEALLELKFKELLFNLVINPENKPLLSWFNNLADGHQQPLQEIMEANFTSNMPIEEFARLSQRSLAAFKRDFQTAFQTSPGLWLKNKRLDYAGLLLRTSVKRVTDISFESGFENNTHFSRAFREKFGMTPLHFRKQKAPMNS